MDKKKIIDEGLLEGFLLGTLSREDEALVLRALEKDQELKKNFEALEQEFEQIGMENAIEPPARVKDRLKKSLEQTVASEKDGFGSGRLLIAASMAALFALSSFWLYTKWQDSVDDLKSLEEQTVNMQGRLDALEQQYELTSLRYSSINDPEVIPLYLTGNQISPQSRATAYIHHGKRTVIVNGKGLQPLDQEHTYQMWADVDGEMINMGLVPSDQDFILLRYIDKAESLNITIEPSGGSDHPTVEKLISNVYF